MLFTLDALLTDRIINLPPQSMLRPQVEAKGVGGVGIEPNRFKKRLIRLPLTCEIAFQISDSPPQGKSNVVGS